MSGETFQLHVKPTAITNEYDLSKTVLGTGITGNVIQCKHKETKKEYALKVLVSNSKSKREIDLHKRASDCDNIVKIVDVFENNNKNTGKNHLLVVMECMKGGELFNRIQERSHSQFTEREAVSIVVQIARAIRYLHRLNIAHRDLKPENLLFESTQPNATLKLTDFGFAKEILPGHQVNTPCYTPYYAAPEVLGPESYDKSCDLWSLGVITYILLCGYPPFYSHNGQPISPGMKKRIRHGEYGFPKREWDRVSKEAKDFISNLLLVDSRQRFNINQVMCHPWITQYQTVPETPLLTQTTFMEDPQAISLMSEAINCHLREMRVDEMPGVVVKNLDEANNKLLKKRNKDVAEPPG